MVVAIRADVHLDRLGQTFAGCSHHIHRTSGRLALLEPSGSGKAASESEPARRRGFGHASFVPLEGGLRLIVVVRMERF